VWLKTPREKPPVKQPRCKWKSQETSFGSGCEWEPQNFPEERPQFNLKKVVREKKKKPLCWEKQKFLIPRKSVK